MQEPLFSNPSAKPFDELLARALGAPVALAGPALDLLVLWQVLHHSFRGSSTTSWAMMVPVMVTTVEIVRFRLSAAPTNRTRPS